jgi:hypothetical protein
LNAAYEPRANPAFTGTLSFAKTPSGVK